MLNYYIKYNRYTKINVIKYIGNNIMPVTWYNVSSY